MPSILSHQECLENILDKVLGDIKFLAKTDPAYYLTRDGRKFEVDVFNFLTHRCVRTPFEGTVKLVSGQKFPDITCGDHFGIEVKTTLKDHWVTTGNSILESTRVDGIEKVYIFFGKLAGDIDFMWRPYEECLTEVVTTHYPRYKIDMRIEKGKSIFDKMNIPYEELRCMNKPVAPIAKYYKDRLKPGEDLWWSDSDEGSSFSIRLLNKIPADEKDAIVRKAMVLFPEIFGGSQKKFENIPAWLASHYSIVSSSLRDQFTASGTVEMVIGGQNYTQAPRIVHNLYTWLSDIEEILRESDTEELKYHWKDNEVTQVNKIEKWIEYVTRYLRTLPKHPQLFVLVRRDLENRLL